MWRLHPVVSLLLVLSACSSSAKQKAPPDAHAEAGADAAIPEPTGKPVGKPPNEAEREPDGDCDDVGGFYATRTFAQPRGTEIDVVLTPAAKGTLDPKRDYAHCIQQSGAWKREFTAGLTLLVVRPDGKAEATLTALEAFLADRPKDDAIGAVLWTDSLLPIDIPTRDRARTLSRIRVALAGQGAAPSVTTLPSAVSGLSHAFGGDALPWFRSVVVWAPGLDQALTAPTAVAATGATFVGLLPVGDDLEAHALALSAGLDEIAARGFYGVGVCDAGKTTLRAGAQTLSLDLPDLPWEFARGPACDPDLTAIAAFPHMDVMQLSLTADQRAVYEQRIAAKDKADFPISTQWHEALPVTSSIAHLRGKSSFGCARKNFALDLLGGEGRPMFPGMLSDELYLMSMCLDDAYVNQITGDRLMAATGLFPLAFDVIEMRLDAVSQGPYLALEKPQTKLQSLYGTLHSVIRRGEDFNGGLSEVQWSREGDATAALASYDELLKSLDGLTGDALVSALETRLDLDQFLRMIALMSVLENGDYIDELFFYATDSVDASGAVRPFYSVMGWDPDDLFSACHHSSKWAIVDPHGLLYCAEGLLEHRILLEPAIYGRFVSKLEEVRATLNQDSFESAVDQTVEDVTKLFDREAVRAASVDLLKKHPEATTTQAAKDVIIAAGESLKTAFAARSKLLAARIESYRSP